MSGGWNTAYPSSDACCYLLLTCRYSLTVASSNTSAQGIANSFAEVPTLRAPDPHCTSAVPPRTSSPCLCLTGGMRPNTFLQIKDTGVPDLQPSLTALTYSDPLLGLVPNTILHSLVALESQESAASAPLAPTTPQCKQLPICRAQELGTHLDDNCLVPLINIFEKDKSAADAYLVLKRAM
ncbi:hypothetical protein NUW54_g559 [Trametes sanguinea]|uniref:Uncharacterized protein n=2 Tax=Trametes sanguinea TaxID=158606 RepID=A0ACC1QCP9_9APHY|nr:hypothetical protein NUW54_g1438 [Trametes sanguinea]KAJ3017546.1 hypothetical protein NUW54_g559 [Trametes sanguinea]